MSAGALLGGALFHLIPEAIETLSADIIIVMILIFVGFIIFFIIEKILQWRHCHKTDCEIHDQETFGYMNLIGDGFHNFIDGLIIAASFLGPNTGGNFSSAWNSFVIPFAKSFSEPTITRLYGG